MATVSESEVSLWLTKKKKELTFNIQSRKLEYMLCKDRNIKFYNLRVKLKAEHGWDEEEFLDEKPTRVSLHISRYVEGGLVEDPIVTP